MPDRAKCPSCGLVQWVAESGECRRCAAPLFGAGRPAAPVPVGAYPAPAAAVPAWRAYLVPAVAVAVLLLVCVAGWRWLRVALRVHGVAVSRFEDGSSNLRLIFSDPGWCFLDVASTHLRAPQWGGEVMRDTIRGAFFLRDGADGPPVALLVMRIEGTMGLSVQPLQPPERAIYQQNAHRQAISALGGQYFAMLPGDGGDKGPESPVASLVMDELGRMVDVAAKPGTLRFGRFSPIRVEGRAVVPGGYCLWSDPGPFRVITLISLEDARIYYAHIVMPEESLPALEKVARVIADPIAALRKPN
jgi:hypothetical protein